MTKVIIYGQSDPIYGQSDPIYGQSDPNWLNEIYAQSDPKFMLKVIPSPRCLINMSFFKDVPQKSFSLSASQSIS